LYKVIVGLQKGYQPRTNIVKHDKADLVIDCHTILAGWKNHFCHLWNVHGVNDVRQRHIHTAEPLLHEPRAFEFEMTIEKPNGHKSLCTDRIPAEMIMAEWRIILSEIHYRINSIWDKEELPG
jgi:hypothetical protein